MQVGNRVMILKDWAVSKKGSSGIVVKLYSSSAQVKIDTNERCVSVSKYTININQAYLAVGSCNEALSVTNAAKLLGVSQSTVYRLINSGAIKADTQIKRYSISHKEISNYLERDQI